MTLETWVQIAELIAAVAVVISLVYLALQVRQSNRVNSASARHAISEFAMQVSMFHAQHADRLAKVHSEQPLTEGDQLFRWWAHMQFFLHAETYHRQYELGLMPAAHWEGYTKFFRDYLRTPGAKEFWQDVGYGFSREFSSWVDGLVQGLDDPNA